MKRILLTTVPTAFLTYGGGEREIHLLNEALNSVGLISDIYGPTSRPLDNYDCVIHFSMLEGAEQIIEIFASKGMRLILWPNLWFVHEPDIAHLERLSRFLSRFDAVVFRTKTEQDHFGRYFDLSGKCVLRVSSLLSSKFLRKDVSCVFRESYGLGPYAIWPGIIEPQKNQLAAVKAFRGLDIELVFSGWVRDQRYMEECRRAAASNVHFIPAMPFCSELHLSALAHSSLFVELSLDFPGTSALEADIMGMPLLLSRSTWTEEVLKGRCVQVDPMDIEAIHVAALRMLQGPKVAKIQQPYYDMATAIDPLVRYIQSQP